VSRAEQHTTHPIQRRREKKKDMKSGPRPRGATKHSRVTIDKRANGGSALLRKHNTTQDVTVRPVHATEQHTQQRGETTYPLLGETKGTLVQLVTHQLNDTLLVRSIAADLTNDVLHENAALAGGLLRECNASKHSERGRRPAKRGEKRGGGEERRGRKTAALFGEPNDTTTMTLTSARAHTHTHTPRTETSR
jgi:hypothetical protein